MWITRRYEAGFRVVAFFAVENVLRPAFGLLESSYILQTKSISNMAWMLHLALGIGLSILSWPSVAPEPDGRARRPGVVRVWRLNPAIGRGGWKWFECGAGSALGFGIQYASWTGSSA